MTIMTMHGHRSGNDVNNTVSAAIEVVGLQKSYGTGRHRRTVLDGVTFEVTGGTIVTLLGHNGAGKTTTVRILTTLLGFDSGQARIFGADVRHDPDRVRSMIAVTGQFAAVDENLTGLENLVFFGELKGLSGRQARHRAGELLDQFGLADAARQKVSGYSGGMRRRLDIAVSLCVVPRLLFLDEPTTGLDPISRADLWRYIRQLRDGGLTVLLTTQYLDEAEALSDRIVILKDHEVAAEGTPEDLRHRLGGSVCTVVLEDKTLAEAFRDAVRSGTAGMSARPVLTGEPGPTTPSDSTTRQGPAAVDVSRLAEGYQVSFRTEEPGAAVRRIAEALGRTGAHPRSVSVAPPTLDDVFVHLMTDGADS